MNSHPFDKFVNGQADPDCGIKVGDLITGYHKGYWIVTEVVKQFVEKTSRWRPNWKVGDSMPSDIKMRRVADDDGTPMPNSKMKKQCCATYCRVQNPQFINQIYKVREQRIAQERDNVLSIYEEIQKGNIKP